MLSPARTCILLVVFGMAACASRSTPHAPRTGHVPASSPTPSVNASELGSNDVEPEPARAPQQETILGDFEALDVPGFLPAVLSVPKTSQPLPLFVSTHGAGGDPEAHCQFWQQILGARKILLCLRGAELRRGTPSGHYYPNHLVLERELVAALAALRDKYGAQLLDRGAVYAGYSQGATMGALMIAEHAALFDRLILIEGGFAQWSPASARKFRQNGGKKVLFACGGTGCTKQAKNSAAMLNKAGAETRVEHAVGAGHTYGGEVEQRVRSALPWLLDEN